MVELLDLSKQRDIMSKASHIIGRMASARESAYYKIEQEADLQRHSRRLLQEGKLQDMAGYRLGGKVAKTITDSSASFEVLAEILQQRARVHDPHAAKRQEFVRRVKGVPTKVTAAELARWRSSKVGIASMVGHVPRMAWGSRDRYGLAAAAAAETASPLVLSPEVIEVAARTQAAGMRAFVYGSVLGTVGIALGSTVGLYALEVRSMEDVRDAIRKAAVPKAAAIRKRFEPLRQWTKAVTGKEGLEDLSAVDVALAVPNQSSE